MKDTKRKREEKIKKTKEEGGGRKSRRWCLAKRLLEVSGGGMEVETVSPNEESRQEAAAG